MFHGFASSSFIKSKDPKVVISAIYKIWIQVYGAPTKFITNNGVEFANYDFKEMCEAMTIIYQL